MLLTDQISLSDSLYVSRYWAICMLKLIVNQAVTSNILKLFFIFLIKSYCYMTQKKSQGKNLNILRTKRAFEVK